MTQYHGQNPNGPTQLIKEINMILGHPESLLLFCLEDINLKDLITHTSHHRY